MRNYVAALLCLVATACQQKPGEPARPNTRARPSDVRNTKVNEFVQPAPRFIDRSLLGSELGRDGMVAKESGSFTAGQPIYLTLVLAESPPGLQTSAVWTGPDKTPLRTERKQMNGAKVATFGFSDRKMKPGHYRVVGYWGGNIATEREFDVREAAKGKRKKG